MNDDPFIVVLDAGHGGHDPGNLGNGYMEKNIALNIALKAGDYLSKQSGVKVIYTRDDDTFVDLYKRGEIANKAKADLFVSIHCDSHSSDAHGAGTFVLGLHANEQNFEIAKKENSVIYLEDNYEARYSEYDINSPESIIGLTIMQEEFLDQSILLAKLMQENFSQSLKRNDRKVKQAGFIVLHQTFMPSVLVETGFLTNRSEGSYLNSNKGQSEMGKAIADAIIKYKSNVRAFPDNAPVITSVPDPESAEVAKEQQETVAVEKKQTPSSQPQNASTTVAKTQIKEEKPVQTKAATTPSKEETKKNREEKTKAKQSVSFKVQLLASSKNIPLEPGEFNGLGKLSKEPFQDLFRYFYGNTNSYDEAKLLKANADQKGFNTSFIVAYKDGKRISVTKALEYLSE
ncbi:N-acetylmuramoyl-L-alanine amidase [Zeaxanthinibacter sp. PT1]|uniref:N-acetylmuramoyl-L-alanine amidase family protein n=1 Tax=Zeaxanthinibacter TaxID=561554 RepID=UPI0023496A47|nr:N-acetylmuramoyl-L-alanine amidase [Zeaxanthinibacter sp. PT1]MDC6352750.1 N-acetylmuramoyl-L-alanine amidase [Zeaxanthinibacter sp. PT1]